MDISSKENIVGMTVNRALLKPSATPSVKKPLTTKKALADVGNIIHSAKKNKLDFSKPDESSSKQVDFKNFKVFVEEKDVQHSPAPRKTNSERIPLSPISGTKVAANLHPSYFDESEDEDAHYFCSDHGYSDGFDDLIPSNLRFNDDDMNSLAMLKPSEEPWELSWKQNISAVSDESDLNDFNVPFPSPPKFAEFDNPFSDFIIPGVPMDDSF